MKKIVNTLISIIALSALSLGQNYAYVVNGLAETLSRIDLETGVVENHIVTLGAVPNQVVHYENELFVVNSLSPSLMVIDPLTNEITAEMALPTNSNPWNVDVFGQYAYVTGLAANSAYKVDLIDQQLDDTWETGLSPEGVLVYEGKLFVTNTAFNPVDFSYGQGSVSVFDLSSGNEIDRINVGKNPQNLLVGYNGLLNVICTGDYVTNFGIVYFIDRNDLTIADSLALGGSPTVAVMDAAGRAYVAAGGWVDHGHVYKYDTVTRELINGSGNPITLDLGVMGVAIDELGVLYAACQLSNTINTFMPDGQVENVFNVGSGPSSVAIIDSRVSVDEETVAIPDKVKLGLPYPNPFNASVNIPVSGPIDDIKYVEIYDIGGRLVKKLSILSNITINNTVTWNVEDNDSQEVASGVYFARLTGTSQAVKMVLLR